MIKTSHTHPLRIDTLGVPGTSGTIGLTLCPGRHGSSLAGGSWSRDLATDLEAVRAWNPAIVVALLEDHEYADLDVPQFKRDVVASGLPWVFPEIVDGGVPDEIFERAWESLGPRVRGALRGGKNVLLHCRAGLGRTGTIAAVLLVEFGVDPEEAIAAVRHARPNAIENRDQENYVRSARPVPPPAAP